MCFGLRVEARVYKIKKRQVPNIFWGLTWCWSCFLEDGAGASADCVKVRMDPEFAKGLSAPPLHLSRSSLSRRILFQRNSERTKPICAPGPAFSHTQTHTLAVIRESQRSKHTHRRGKGTTSCAIRRKIFETGPRPNFNLALSIFKNLIVLVNKNQISTEIDWNLN